jgi:ABC-type lipoprotein export system ATPase subunit
MTAIHIFGLRYRYPGADHDVLQVASLDIDSPGLTAVTGPSGSGKSTLVELIAGTLREPYSGELDVLGVDIQTLRRDADRQRHLRRIGLIPQDFGLLPTATVREILTQDLADADIERAERPSRIATALTQVGLSEFIDRKSAMLSGGQRQRVAIARMLARDVELVIADEPTANLDPALVAEVLTLLRDLAKTRAVVIVTHDTRVAELCDHSVQLPVPTSLRPLLRTHFSLRGWRVAAPIIVLAFLVTGVTAMALASSSKSPSQVTTTPSGGDPNAPPSTRGPVTSAGTVAAAPTLWPFPVQPEDCGPVDSNGLPAVCPDGRPNLQTIEYFSGSPSALLHLGPSASATQVLAAACSDYARNVTLGTVPLVTTEAQLAWAENGWSFSNGDVQNALANGCATPTAIPTAMPTAQPFAYCGLYVPGKNAQITVEGPGVSGSTCSALIPYLHHNVGDWYLVSPPPTANPASGLRCDVPATLVPPGDWGYVTDTGTFSTATGDNACSDLPAA